MTSVAVNYAISGADDAPAVVLSGSLGSDLRMWDAQAAALSDHWRVIRYDHRGHGQSPAPPGPYSLEELGADAVALLDGLGVARAHVVGLSLGGMVGLWLAAHHPDRVDHLVVLCSSAYLGPPQPWHDRAATVRAGGTDTVVQAVVDRWLTPAGAAGDPDLVLRLRTMAAATAAEGYASCCEAIAGTDLRGDLDRIGAPTLLIAGAQDPAAPPEYAERIAAAVPGARVVVLEGVAHLANVERPDAVTGLVRDHLRQE
jgi:3-oxoadipate enol-lactonase